MKVRSTPSRAFLFVLVWSRVGLADGSLVWLGRCVYLFAKRNDENARNKKKGVTKKGYEL